MAEDWARPVVHWEIQVRDIEKQRKFYSELFNWDITGHERAMGIPVQVGPPERLRGNLRLGDTPRVVLYVQVLKIRESLDKAVLLGGKILREPFDRPSGQTLAIIEDPEGNPVTLVQQ